MNLPQKNERCPCGSGKKFKQCCGKRNSIITEKATPKQLNTIHFLVNQGSIDAAIVFIKKEEAEASSIELKLYLIFLYLKNNNFFAASNLVKSIPTINTKLDILTKIFARLTNLRRFDLVCDFYQQLQINFNEPSIRALHIQSQIELGEYKKANLKLEPLVEELGFGANKYGLCSLAHKAGSYELAVKCFEQVLPHEGENSYATKVAFSMALHKIGDHHKALSILNDINGKHKNITDALVLKINILLATNDLIGARSQIESLALDNKSNKELLQLKWKVLSSSGSGKELLSFAKEIFASRPNEDWVVSQYIKTLHELGLKQEKIKIQESQLGTGYSKSVGSLSGYAMTLLYFASFLEQEIYKAHVNAASAITEKACVSKNTKNKKIRIGYVSSDFKQHSVFYFICPVLKAHDKSVFEIYAYYNGRTFDAKTEEIKGSVDAWRPISFMDTDSVIQVIQDDEIDILIDLNGHTKGHRLDVFANRVCNVQMTWLGYPATTGLKTVDYRLTDSYVDCNLRNQAFYTEKLIEVSKNNFSVYQPEKDTPEVSTSPAAKNGFITFGSFNNYAKIDEQTLVMWAEILQRIPDSRLVIKNKAMRFDLTKKHVLEVFEKNGILEERLSLLDRDTETNHHLSTVGNVDISLDTFPYSGTTTTCESLWMGVPVITLKGYSHRSRVSAGILTCVGLSDYVASSREEYISIAINKAAQLEELSSTRYGLREAMSKSSLMDYKNFTSLFEKTLTELCRKK